MIAHITQRIQQEYQSKRQSEQSVVKEVPLPPPILIKPKINRELQQLQMDEIKEALLSDPKSEQSMLFQLLCGGFSTEADPKMQEKMMHREDHL